MSNLKLLDWSITKAQVSPRITSAAKFIVSNGHYLAEDMEKLDPVLKELSDAICTINKRQETRNVISLQAT